MPRRPRTRRRALQLSGAALGTLLAGCSAITGSSPRSQPTESPSPEETSTTQSPTPTATPATPIAVTTPAERVAYRNTKFGIDLFRTITTGTDNLLLSPYSVGVALAMTYAGARGTTRSQMRATLHYPFPEQRLHRAFRTIHDRLLPDDQAGATPTPTPTPTSTTETAAPDYNIPLRVYDANRVWGQQGFPWRDAYLSLLDRCYEAGFESIDFDSPTASRRRINDWVAQVTRGEVPTLLPDGAITPDTRLVLTNALYFQALWQYQFPPSKTEPRRFTSLDGTATELPMMRLHEGLPYAAVDGHQLVELPYRRGSFGMVIILPPEGEYRAFERSLTADRLWRWMAQLEERVGRVRLPRFAFDTSEQLKSVLGGLGMSTAFGPEADFSGMTSTETNGLAIKDVYHETSIAVDEKGTTATAASGVVMLVSRTVGDEFEMTVDRPFSFVIRERGTGTVLFMGRVTDGAAAAFEP